MMRLMERVAWKLNTAAQGRHSSAPDEYHLWYYTRKVWDSTTFLGVRTQKLPSDMWNYQEILSQLKPALVIEFGSCCGGSALFFASILRQITAKFCVFSVDVDHSRLAERAWADKDIRFLTTSSADPKVAEEITKLRQQFPGPIFAILDSDHTKKHVLAEMMLLRPLLTKGDYVIVEDSNINGHPVLPVFGPGPYEAIAEYEAQFPNDFMHDSVREQKFGCTFAPNGFLVKT